MDRRRPPSLNREDAFVSPCDCSSCRYDAAMRLADALALAEYYVEVAGRVARGLERLAALLQEELHAGVFST